jgi:alkanesulfonate monooxygenase SsuD/methylene tetrahydromethanopterin reductase-like flavin-dependent oxidoreductase (luciferase family)
VSAGPVKVGTIPPVSLGDDADAARAELAEVVSAGVDHLVVGDHVSFFGGFGIDGLVHATALSMLVPEEPIHTSVYLLVLRHPVIVARQLSTLSSLAPGRLVFGVGIGGEDRNEVACCGVDPATRGRRMDESMAVVRHLLTGEAVTHRGDFFTLDGTAVLPAPAQPIPLVVGGRSAAAVRRAGRLGDGWLGIWVSPERFAHAVAEVAEVSGLAGRAEIDWQHGMTVWCGFGQDRADGESVVSRAMEGLYGVPFAKFDRYVPRGTPADVADALRPYVEAGCRTFNLLAQSADRRSTAAAVGEVRRLLNPDR